MSNMHAVKLSLVMLLCLLLNSCSVIEMSGTMTRKTGEVMEDYSEEHEGFFAKMAGLGGTINKSVGSAVENVAHRGESGKLGETKSDQFKEANKTVINSALDAASDKPMNNSKTVMAAQKRLSVLGYDPGPSDGIMGQKTRSAIGQYQQSNGLPITEILDEATLHSLGITGSE